MINNNITNRYLERVETMTSTLPSLEVRHQMIEEINEEYYQEVGQNLPSFLLEMLGTWYLQETYSDRRTNKVSVEEYPVLTESQILRRNRKVVHIYDEYVLETLNYHLRNNSSTSKRNQDTLKGENKDDEN